MFERLGSFTSRRFVWVIVGWIAVAGLVQATAPPLRDVATYDETAFLTADAESVRAAEVLNETWPEDEFGNSAAIVLTRDGRLGDADFAYLEQLEAWLNSPAAPKVVRGTQSVRSRPELSEILTSPDGSGTILITQFSTPPFEPPTDEAVVSIREHIGESRPPSGLSVHVTGNAGVAADQSNAIQESIDRTTIITLILVILILLWVYRSPVTVLVPLITIGIAFSVSQGVVALLAQQGMKVSSLVENFMVVIIFGAGTDYCLFIISRFREEVGHAHEYRRTLAATIAVVGAVIASSGATVIVGFVSQGVAKFGMFRTVGPAMAAAVVVTLAAGLTLTPALMRAFGRNLFWPAHPERLAAAGSLPELQVAEALGPGTPARPEEPDEPPEHEPEPEPETAPRAKDKVRAASASKPKRRTAPRRRASTAQATRGRR